MEAFVLTPQELLEEAVKILDKTKAENVLAIDIAEVSSIADYFLIASGGSTTQVRALAEELEFRLSEKGVEPLHIETERAPTWAILDYGSLVIHVFHRETREFYNLERLWTDGKVIDLSHLLNQEDKTVECTNKSGSAD